MKTQQKIIAESLDDLVFANRNTSYGAYEIRKSYARFVNRAAAISILILLTAVAIPLIASYTSLHRIVLESNTVTASFADMERPPAETAPPPPPPPLSEDVSRKLKFTTPRLVDPDSITDDNSINQEILSTRVKNDSVTTTGSTQTDPKPTVLDEPDTSPILLIVEEMPEFPGGEEARIRYLQENLSYPREAREAGIQGTVYVTFVVDAKGRVTDISLTRGIGGGCDEEALRVISAMPIWHPGKQAGQAVRVKFTVPVRFTLN